MPLRKNFLPLSFLNLFCFSSIRNSEKEKKKQNMYSKIEILFLVTGWSLYPWESERLNCFFPRKYMHSFLRLETDLAIILVFSESFVPRALLKNAYISITVRYLYLRLCYDSKVQLPCTTDINKREVQCGRCSDDIMNLYTGRWLERIPINVRIKKVINFVFKSDIKTWDLGIKQN